MILDYLDNENSQDNLQKIASYYENEKIREDKKEFLELIKMIETISEDHYHSTNFYKKIEQILSLFKNDIQQVLSNKEIVNIFKSNIRILLFLLNEKIVVLDKKIVNFMRSKYSVYFYPEIKEFESEAINKIKIGFVEKKNETNNGVDDIEHSKLKFDYDNGNANLSDFETNSFLQKNHPTIIEYTAFFGSINIFKYLTVNKCELKPSI